MIRLIPPVDEITARVIERRFFGHDQLITVELPTGQRLLSRAFGSASWHPGDLAAITIDGPVQVFE